MNNKLVLRIDYYKHRTTTHKQQAKIYITEIILIDNENKK